MPVVLDPWLRDILACPCPAHAPLQVGTPADPDADALTCTCCQRSFPVVDGIPVLLLDEAFRAGKSAAGDETGPTDTPA